MSGQASAKVLHSVIAGASAALGLASADEHTEISYCSEINTTVSAMLLESQPNLLLFDDLCMVSNSALDIPAADIDTCGFPCPPYSSLNNNRGADSIDALLGANLPGRALLALVGNSARRPSKFSFRENVTAVCLFNRFAQIAGPEGL